MGLEGKIQGESFFDNSVIKYSTGTILGLSVTYLVGGAIFGAVESLYTPLIKVYENIAKLF